MKVTQDLFMGTAEGLMSRKVIALPRDMLLSDAIRVLAQARIGGAPVVDAQGRCIGVFSTVDLLRRMQPGNRAARLPSPVPDCVCSDWKIIDDDDWESFPEDSVSQYMTPDPIVAAPATPVGELAKMMADAHIHRLIVADADCRPIGIVSSTDLLAAVARAARRMECGRVDEAGDGSFPASDAPGWSPTVIGPPARVDAEINEELRRY
ncbi:MAG: CBS domain-containing protein [Stellaceae bacterium]